MSIQLQDTNFRFRPQKAQVDQIATSPQIVAAALLLFMGSQFDANFFSRKLGGL